MWALEYNGHLPVQHIVCWLCLHSYVAAIERWSFVLACHPAVSGKLVCCDFCPRVYHLRCLPPADAAKLRLPTGHQQASTDEDWCCPRCRRAMRLGFCLHRILGQARPRRTLELRSRATTVRSPRLAAPMSHTPAPPPADARRGGRRRARDGRGAVRVHGGRAA